jgi:hypothetical protein
MEHAPRTVALFPTPWAPEWSNSTWIMGRTPQARFRLIPLDVDRGAPLVDPLVRVRPKSDLALIRPPAGRMDHVPAERQTDKA